MHFSHAVTTPFTVTDVQAFANHINQYHGLTLVVQDAVAGRVALTAAAGNWNVYGYEIDPDTQQPRISEDIVDLDELVVEHLIEGEVAVFQTVSFDSDNLDIGSFIYAVNSSGHSHSQDSENEVLRMLGMLGAPEEGSLADVLANGGVYNPPEDEDLPAPNNGPLI